VGLEKGFGVYHITFTSALKCSDYLVYNYLFREKELLCFSYFSKKNGEMNM
jgi:hypothetical protein